MDFRLALGWRQYSISNKSKEVVFLFIVFAWHEVGGTKMAQYFQPFFISILTKVGDVFLVIQNNVVK